MDRDRARIVCKTCHARKVKCDLQDSRDGVCYNCRRANETCCPRESLRKKKSQASASSTRGVLQRASTPGSSAQSRVRTPRLQPGPLLAGLEAGQPFSASSTETDRVGFVGDESVLACSLDPTTNNEARDSASNSSHLPDDITEKILELTGAGQPPSNVMLQAMLDLYFAHAYHRIPVIDRADLSSSDSPILLQQAICLVASLLRIPPDGSTTQALAHPFYRNTKVLLDLNLEPNNGTKLKAMCLLTAWSMTPPSVVSMDTPWHWNGVALRLALQMGLHRGATYEGRDDTGITRRIWWSIFGTNVLQAACFGRPLGITLDDFDVQLPLAKDFHDGAAQGLTFIESCKLISIMAKILQVNVQRRHYPPVDATHIMDSLKDWIRQLPTQLQLFDDDGRRRYCRLSSELFVLYFVCIVLFFRMCSSTHSKPTAHEAPLVAASCIAALYEEMVYRDDINFLFPIHNYFAMVAGVLLIDISRSPLDVQGDVLQDVCIIKNMLRRMSIKWPASKAVLARMACLEKQQQSHGAKTSTPSRTPDLFMHGRMPGQPHTLSNEQADNVLSVLFPFPSTMHPRLAYLRAATGAEPISDFSAEGNMTATAGGQTQWILDDDYLDLAMFDADFRSLQEQDLLDFNPSGQFENL